MGFKTDEQRKAVMAKIGGRIKSAVNPQVIGIMKVNATIRENNFGQGIIMLPDGREVRVGNGNLKGVVGEKIKVELNTSGTVVNFPREENEFVDRKVERE